ncbi:macro domain-containing protein [Lignipirellula cremea]|uniref:Macro domain-containing protein n=1 Tax=Lignipirellula cremea TaxID=2528010 RepID=A0A518DSB6_9BACT|nr:macro domain-containing protein [Lignipirellula cremea]QDU94740.1 hypothetical protein Pla8534_25460 [Lignipirellula cremea]
MPVWQMIHGDLLDLEADGLLCSANPQRNLSGGVGGAFLLRYGPAMQTYLHDERGQREPPYVGPGQAVVAPGCGSPCLAVAHAVAIDAFYNTTTDSIAAKPFDLLVTVFPDRR